MLNVKTRHPLFSIGCLLLFIPCLVRARVCVEEANEDEEGRGKG